MPGRVRDRAGMNVLFLCTHNSARSILAEATLSHLGGGRFRGHSASSSPRPNQQPHPLALQVLEQAGISTPGLRSKGWDEFARPDAPRMDLVITVCDAAAGETCPVWLGHPATAHWSYPDPSAVQGTEAQQLQAFDETLHAIRERIALFLALPQCGIDHRLLQDHARRLASG